MTVDPHTLHTDPAVLAELPAPRLEFVFEIRASIAPDHHIGRGVDEALSFTPVTGGSVRGPALNGKVLSGGGDWAVTRSGTAELEARYLIRAEDGAVIDIVNRGYFRATPDLLSRMEAGEDLPETTDGLYFRTAPVFQTDAPAHRWLAEHQFVGLARDDRGQVCVRVFVLR